MGLASSAVLAVPGATITPDPPMFALAAKPLLNRRRRIAPGAHARVNPTHSLARGIKFCFVAGKDIVGAMPLTTTVASRTTAWGRGFTGVATNANSTALNFGAGQAFSLLCAGHLTGNTVGITLFGRHTYVDETTNSGWRLRRTSGHLVFDGFHNTAIANYSQTQTTAFTVGPYVAVATMIPTVQAWLFGLNEKFGTGIATNANVSTEATGSLTIGDNNDGNVVAIAAAWNRSLNDAEAWQLQADPFCFLTF